MLLMVNPSFQQCTPGLFVVFVVCCLFVLLCFKEIVNFCGRLIHRKKAGSEVKDGAGVTVEE